MSSERSIAICDLIYGESPCRRVTQRHGDAERTAPHIVAQPHAKSNGDDCMKYTEGREELIWNLRLDFDPVGVRFATDESEIDKLPVTHRAKSRLSYCQHLAAVRQARHVLLMRPGDCLCRNAQPVFGFRELDRESDTKMHMKYFQDPELSWRAASGRAGLEPGSCKGVYMAPLDCFDRAEAAPDVVFILCVPYQAYHILNDYMGATRRPNLSFFQTPTSAVWSGSIWAFKNKTANLTTMCSGSKTSGKTEMNYIRNLETE